MRFFRAAGQAATRRGAAVWQHLFIGSGGDLFGARRQKGVFVSVKMEQFLGIAVIDRTSTCAISHHVTLPAWIGIRSCCRAMVMLTQAKEMAELVSRRPIGAAIEIED